MNGEEIQATDMARIDFAQYMESLLSHLWHSYGNESSYINLVKDLKNSEISGGTTAHEAKNIKRKNSDF